MSKYQKLQDSARDVTHYVKTQVDQK